MWRRKILVFCGLFSCVISGIKANDVIEATIDSLIHLDEVVVSANKIHVNKNSVPLSITVIGREEIEASSESALLPVLSQRVPGLFVTQKGITGFGISSGSAGMVNIRGVGGGNKVLMLFDGQPQWAGVFGHALPDTYVASDVEKVEIIRGPGSFLYGSNAMGGVVNIITRQHKKKGRRTQARVMYGSFNTQKYMLNNGYNTDNFSSFISINHDRTDGHRENSEFHITNGYANLGYKLNEQYKIGGSVSYAAFKTHNPGALNDPMIDNIMDIGRGTASLSLKNEHQKTSGEIQTFYNWGLHKVNDGHKPGTPSLSFLFRSEDFNRGLLLHQSFRLLPGNSFTVGVDYKNWGGHAWNDTINHQKGEIVDKSVHELAGYVVAQQELFNKIYVNAGIRLEHSSSYGSHWTPQAGLTYHPFEYNTIKASFSKGFRSPTLRELYISYLPYSKANPDLKPESMLNYEISIAQYLFHRKLSIELTGFYIDGKNMIQGMQGQLQNIGSFYNKGIEMEILFRPLTNLSFTANYSYLHTNKRIIAAPKHKFFTEVMYKIGRFSATVNVQSIAGLYPNTSIAEPKAENYTLLNSRFAYKIGDDDRFINLFVKGENLTATRYQINDGFPMPKAIVMGGFDICF